MKQGAGSTTSWKPRLSNYKSHVKKKKLTCRIMRRFIENRNDNGFERTLVRQHHGLNSKHDLNRKKRCEREKLNH